MTQTVTLELSDAVVDRARAEAERTGRRYEEILADAIDLALLPLTASADRFSQLVERWKSERGPHSSPVRLTDHPAYAEIIALGQQAIPLVLAELRREPDHWFIALRKLTGVDPVRPESRGHLDAMAADWLTWGRKEGYRC